MTFLFWTLALLLLFVLLFMDCDIFAVLAEILGFLTFVLITIALFIIVL